MFVVFHILMSGLFLIDSEIILFGNLIVQEYEMDKLKLNSHFEIWNIIYHLVSLKTLFYSINSQ